MLVAVSSSEKLAADFSGSGDTSLSCSEECFRCFFLCFLAGGGELWVGGVRSVVCGENRVSLTSFLVRGWETCACAFASSAEELGRERKRETTHRDHCHFH